MFSLTTAGINQLCGAIHTQQARANASRQLALTWNFPDRGTCLHVSPTVYRLRSNIVQNKSNAEVDAFITSKIASP
jgi:hypothetical protein